MVRSKDVNTALLDRGSINASESLFLPYGSLFWPGRPLDGGSRLVWFASVKWIAASHWVWFASVKWIAVSHLDWFSPGAWIISRRIWFALGQWMWLSV